MMIGSAVDRPASRRLGVHQVVEEPGGRLVSAVEAADVSLAYRLTRDRAGTMKEFAINFLKRNVKREEFWAVRDVSFSLNPARCSGSSAPTAPARAR